MIWYETMSLNEELNKLFANTREHAPYFAIGDKDRANRWNSEIREFSEVYERSPLLRGIVGKWEEIKSVNQRGRNSEKSDPPDVEVIKRDGQRFGIEVTEFVNCKSIRSGEKGIAELPCEWTEDLFRATMLERISRKDTGWPEFFDCRILLLLCDELNSGWKIAEATSQICKYGSATSISCYLSSVHSQALRNYLS